MKRKWISLGIILGIFLSCFSLPASAAEEKSLSDYFKTGEHTPYVSGYGDNTFAPNNSITRAEAAQMLYSLLKAPAHSTVSQFTDVPLTQWYGQAVNALGQVGVFHGYGDGTFHPNAPITRAELVAALANCVPSAAADNPFSDISSGNWAYRAILTAVANQWISGYTDGTFRPDKTITRAETVVILNKALGRTGAGFAENRTGKYFTDISEDFWAYRHIVEASGATAYQANISASLLRVTVSALNLRSGPGTDYSILATLSENTILTLLDKINDPWIHVRTESGIEGYVHSDYVEEYTPNTAPAEQIKLSSTSVSLPQYKSFRLDGASTPSTALVWSSSNESVVTLSTIRYSEGDESCFVYGKAPGTATVTCSDYSGTVKAQCTVTVQGPEPIRFVFTEPNLITTADSPKLTAITDPQKTVVRFTVQDSAGNTVLSREISTPTAERYGNNETKVFQCPLGLLGAGKYSVQVSSADASGQFSSAENYSFTVHTAEAATMTTDADRDVSDKMVQIIMDYEAYVPVIRDDKVTPRHPTVGYGYVVGTNEAFYNSMTQREAKALLMEKISSNYGGAVNNFRKRNNLKMSQCQYDALVSFAYNLGPGYMNSPTGNYLFTTILNAVVPPGNLSAGNPCSAVLNVKNAPLYAAPDRNAQEKKTITVGTSLRVTGVQRNGETKELWYAVQEGSDTGWMRAGNIRLNAGSAVHDLNYVDSMTFANYLLEYHHGDGVCIPGLLYRRLAEAKLFLYADYEEASPKSASYRRNTYRFIYPSCVKEYE
ncbi:MAG: S-layer homology domain-containing protein [Acutalibacter sp.]|nr:S-layer homology domain-containing protein [Acutalibacter sp.]